MNQETRERRERPATRWQTARLLADLTLVPSRRTGKTWVESDVMLARARPDGILELLTAEAWARALRYPPDELGGKSLRGLMQLEQRAAAELLAALLDEENVQSLDVTLRCKDQRRRCFRFHRRFDPHGESMFVVADELPEERPEPRCG